MANNEVGYGARVRITSEECPHFGGTVLEIEQGKQTDLMFHTKVSKIFYLLHGKLKTTLINKGQMKAFEILKGSSFVVKPGLVYQLHGLEKSVVVEFCDSAPTLVDEDTFVVSKGTQAEQAAPVTPGAFAQMTKEDLQNLKAQGEKVLAERKAKVETTEPETKPATKKTTKRKKSNRSSN